MARLPDGSFSSVIGGVKVRVIAASVTVTCHDGTRYGGECRLATTLLDHRAWPAEALIRPYHERWEHDSLTYDLYFHWLVSHDQRMRPIMNALTATALAVHDDWSDVPVWDAIAAAREYQITGDPAALAKAEAAFGYVAIGGRSHFALGACPSIYYQQPGGGVSKLKTLETGSNYLIAALLLYQITKERSYLRMAQQQYSAVRANFLDRSVPLYTVYVLDNGSACKPLPERYFGSVNGNMIRAGYYLAQATGNRAYLSESIATAQAVQRRLCDASGIYEDCRPKTTWPSHSWRPCIPWPPRITRRSPGTGC